LLFSGSPLQFRHLHAVPEHVVSALDCGCRRVLYVCRRRSCCRILGFRVSNLNNGRCMLVRFGMPFPMHTSLSCTSFLIAQFSLFSRSDTVVSGFGFRYADDVLHLPFMHRRCRTRSRCPQSRSNCKCIISNRMCPSGRQHCTTR
jgi:hypothetical protein